MNIEYYPQSIDFVVHFKQREIETAVTVLKQLLERAPELNMHVPLSPEFFYERPLSPKEGNAFVFSFGYLEFGMLFLDDFYETLAPVDDDIAAQGPEIKKLWDNVQQYCQRDDMLH